MKKRNKYFLKEKDYIRLKKESKRNYQAQQDLGWVECEPYHNGFKAKYVLRNDISNRDDAWVFQEILDRYSTTTFAKKVKDFCFYDGNKTIHKNKWVKIIPNKPEIKSISVDEYNSLSSQLQKYFVSGSAWYGYYYECNIPSFYLEILVEKNFVNKMKVFDEILLQEEAEIDAEICRNHYDKEYNDDGYNRFLKEHNSSKRMRAKAKKVLYQNVYLEKDVEFEDKPKSSYWYYW